MCRYMFAPYKTHYVCVPCRNVAKSHEQRTCPTCREPMIDFGMDFKAPRKEATNQWKKLAILVERGQLFGSGCGCNGPGWRPKTLGEARRSQKRIHHFKNKPVVW